MLYFSHDLKYVAVVCNNIISAQRFTYYYWLFDMVTGGRLDSPKVHITSALVTLLHCWTGPIHMNERSEFFKQG